MMKLWICTLFTTILAFPLFTFADPAEAGEKSCFPTGRGWQDNSCYSLTSKEDCLDLKDEYACGWGISKEKERLPNADGDRTCESARCQNLVEEDDDQ